MNTLLNWGFSPIGSPLGSEGALSMPTDELTGLEQPLEAAEAALEGFAEQTQRRYGDVSDPGGSVWDPRGDRALSHEVADYRTTDMMRPDEIAVSIADLSPELMGGDPVLAPFAASNQLDPSSLEAAGLGLSDAGAATLADALSVQDPAILDTIYLPPQVEPTITNEVGLVSDHGGLPRAFFDSQAGVLHKGMPEAVERVIAAQGQYQHVDENGVVDKYPKGTGPYDSPGLTRPGSVLGAVRNTLIRTAKGIKYGGRRLPVTPADIAASPRLAMGAMAPRPIVQPASARKRLASSQMSALANTAREQLVGSGSSSDFVQNTVSPGTPGTPSGAGTPNAGGDANGLASQNAGQGTSQGTGLSTGSAYVRPATGQGGPVYYPEDVAAEAEAAGCPSWNPRCWWPIAVGAGLAGIGAYLLARKRGK
jgi:hypothetical protein